MARTAEGYAPVRAGAPPPDQLANVRHARCLDDSTSLMQHQSHMFQNPLDLHNVWRRTASRITGQVYYWNVATLDTAWALPPGARLRVQPSVSPPASVHTPPRPDTPPSSASWETPVQAAAPARDPEQRADPPSQIVFDADGDPIPPRPLRDPPRPPSGNDAPADDPAVTFDTLRDRAIVAHAQYCLARPPPWRGRGRGRVHEFLARTPLGAGRGTAPPELWPLTRAHATELYAAHEPPVAQSTGASGSNDPAPVLLEVRPGAGAR